MTATLYPNTDLVAVAWIKSIVDAAVGVGTTLPSDPTSWATDGFVQVTSGVGGTMDAYVPMLSPLVQLDFWANSPNTKAPPWGKANNLAMQVVFAMQNTVYKNKVLTLQGDFPDARLRTVQMNTHPVRIPDPAGYARYMCRAVFHWTPL